MMSQRSYLREGVIGSGRVQKWGKKELELASWQEEEGDDAEVSLQLVQLVHSEDTAGR